MFNVKVFNTALLLHLWSKCLPLMLGYYCSIINDEYEMQVFT